VWHVSAEQIFPDGDMSEMMRGVLQCVAVCCSVLRCAAVCCSVLQHAALQCVAVCCNFSFDVWRVSAEQIFLDDDVCEMMRGALQDTLQQTATHCNTHCNTKSDVWHVFA